MRISDVAARAGATPKAVRYYERLGLLSVDREPNGYREYDESHVDLVREIRSLARLGIPADETRPFLDCIASGADRGDDCPASQATYRETIDELGARIEELTARREALVALLRQAGDRPEPVCEFSAGALAEGSEVGANR